MSQPLSSKDASLFRQVIRNFESKQYKKGLKTADQILRKNPKHGETLAMKALIINSQGRSEEAFTMAKEALRYDMKSHVCWHVYGLLYRTAKNFEEAIKAYKFALRLEPDSPNIQRDLALLQIQMRDYSGYIASRRTMLQSKSAQRQYWTALAVANHLAGNLKTAESILTTYEDTLKVPPSKTDLEHSEAVLYKNTIIAEMGETQRALEHLETISKHNLDRAAVLEMRADYLLKLGKKSDAEKAYRLLIDRNPENRTYFLGLEKALGAEDKEGRKSMEAMYDEYAEKNPRGDAARRIPLDFLEGDDFRQTADKYLRRMLSKGIPSTFANIKALYSDTSKRETIYELVKGYASEEKTTPQENGSAEKQTNGEKEKSHFEESVLYFLAQHYNYHLSRDLHQATAHIDQAIALSPKSVDYHMTKARIWKHYGNTQKASETMEHARSLDEKDRYINTKAAKYQLRNNENDAALKTMSKFTRNENAGGPLGDLHEMQCVWFLTEDGEAFVRQGRNGLALKRFHALYDIFDVWQEDQFDFHSFSLKKGQIRAYVEMVRWEDRLREHPFYSRVAVDAVEVYVRLFDQPHLAHESLSNGTLNGSEDFGNMDESEKKKAIKKAKREQQKQAEAKRKKEEEEEEKDKKKPGASEKPTDTDAAKKEDADPNGQKLAQTDEPLKEAMKFLTPLLEFSAGNIKSQTTGFEVFLRRERYLLALRCLLAAHKLSPSDPTLHEQTVRFKHTLDTLPSPLPPLVSSALSPLLPRLFPSDTLPSSLLKFTTDFASSHSTSAPQVLASLQARRLLQPDTQGALEKEVVQTVEMEGCTLEDARRALVVLKEWRSGNEVVGQLRESAGRRWKEAGGWGREVGHMNEGGEVSKDNGR